MNIIAYFEGGWYSIMFFDLVGESVHKLYQVSKKFFFLYYIHTTYDAISCVKNQVAQTHRRQVAQCLYFKVCGDYEVSNDRGTTGLAFKVPSLELLLFLPLWLYWQLA